MPEELIHLPDPGGDESTPESAEVKWLEEAPRAARLSHRTLVVSSIVIMGLFISPSGISPRDQTLVGALGTLSDQVGAVASAARKNHYPSTKVSKTMKEPRKATPGADVESTSYYWICMVNNSGYLDIKEFSEKALRKEQPTGDLIAALSSTRFFGLPRIDVDKAIFDQLNIVRDEWREFLNDEWTASERPRVDDSQKTGVFTIRLEADCDEDGPDLLITYEVRADEICSVSSVRTWEKNCRAAVDNFQNGRDSLHEWVGNRNLADFAVGELPAAPHLGESVRQIESWSRFREIAELPLDAAKERVRADIEEQNAAWARRERNIMGVAVSTPTPWFVMLVLVGMCMHVGIHLLAIARVALSGPSEQSSVRLFPWIGTMPGWGVGIAFFLVTFIPPVAASLSVRATVVIDEYNKSALAEQDPYYGFKSYFDLVTQNMGLTELFVLIAAMCAGGAGTFLRVALRCPERIKDKYPRFISGWF